MTDNKLTDEELWEKYSFPNWMGKTSFMEAIREARKGMFTEDEVKMLMMDAITGRTITYAKERLTQYLTERKGRG